MMNSRKNCHAFCVQGLVQGMNIELQGKVGHWSMTPKLTAFWVIFIWASSTRCRNSKSELCTQLTTTKQLPYLLLRYGKDWN